MNSGSSGKTEQEIPPIGGEAFVDHFFQNRQKIIQQLIQIRSKTTGGQKSLESQWENLLNKELLAETPDSKNDFSTLRQLEKLWHNRTTQAPSTSTEFIDSLQKKFAVFGKIFTRYHLDYSKANEQNNPVALLALFSLIMLRRYGKFQDFNSLNSALKIDDTICHLITRQISGKNPCSLDSFSFTGALLALQQESHELLRMEQV